ncbi:MAG: hypothetical protein ABIP55_10620 [Tepidisphaeraceae bacterium]
MSKESHDGQRGLRWGRIAGALALLVIVAVFLAHWVWGTGASNRLAKQVAAYKGAGEPIEPEDFIVAGVADADNAVLDFRSATAALRKSSEEYKKYDRLDFGFPLRDEEIVVLRKVLADNAAALGHIDNATQKTGVDWQLKFTQPVMLTLLPALNEQRELAMLLAADAMLAHHDGDDARALKRLDQILFMGRANERQPFLVCHLVSIGINALAADRADQLAPDLRIGTDGKAATREQVESLIRQLLDDKPMRDGQKMAFYGERMSQLDTARSLVSGKLNLNQLAGPGGAATNVASAVAGYALRPMFSGDGLIMIQQTTAILSAAQAAADWPGYQKSAPKLPLALMSQPWKHVLARIMMPSLDRAVQTDYRSMTDRRLTAAALAMRLYALDHGGNRPATLSELIPKYLPAIPLDAMAAGAPIRYIPDPKRPLLYSAGENGIDDGGNDTPTNSRPLNPGRWQRMDAVMDLTRQPRLAPQPMDDGVGGLSTQPAATESAIPTEPSPTAPQASTQPAS